MSLYIRLQSSFWTNRKTIRLRAAIGDAAYWIPPRLWSYAADNQPSGDFSDYSDAEIGMLLGYQADAQALLQALHASGFMKDRKINDWREHNGYHTTFSDRARKAAEVRWEKEKGKDKKGQERKGKETSIASSNAKASSFNSDNGITDSEWIARLAQDKTYSGIDVEREHGKMMVWCRAHQVSPTRRRFVNWLNRADKPISSNGQVPNKQKRINQLNERKAELMRLPADESGNLVDRNAGRELQRINMELKEL